MSVPGNINTAPPPSSFDGDADFYEESRWAKLRRRIIEEPLIPLGCALTCWALYEATKSMRTGDKYRTNRMFRRRIYAQGFTILAMLAGSAYWEGDRVKRKQYEGLVEEKKQKEKHAAWIRELEIREQEDEELRKLRDKLMKRETVEKREMKETDKTAVEAKVKEDLGKPKGGLGAVRCVVDEQEARGRSPILEAVRELWERR